MEDLTPEQVSEQVQKEVEEAMDDLGVGRIDLLLLHWPSSGQGGTREYNMLYCFALL